MDLLKREVQATSDADAFGRDTDAWVEYLVRKYGMEPIEADLGSIRMEETTNNGYPSFIVLVPVEQTDTFKVIAKQGLAGQGQWLGFDYRTFFSDGYPGYIGQVVPQTEGDVGRARRRLREYVQSLNSAIEYANRTFPHKLVSGLIALDTSGAIPVLS